MTERKDIRRALKKSDGLVKIATYRDGTPVYDYADKALRDPPAPAWAKTLGILMIVVFGAVALFVAASGGGR